MFFLPGFNELEEEDGQLSMMIGPSPTTVRVVPVTEEFVGKGEYSDDLNQSNVQ